MLVQPHGGVPWRRTAANGGGGRSATPPVARLLQDAATFLQGGKLSDAARCYALVLRHDPDHADALQLLGTVHAQQGRLDSAARLLRSGLDRNPAVAEGHNNLGMILHALTRSEEAIVCYQTAIAIRPGYAIALNNLGVVLAALGRHAEAITRYQEAVAAEPKYAEALNNLGTSLHKSGRNQEAIECFEAALAVRPSFSEAEINLGHALAALDRNLAAIDRFQAVLQRQPGTAELHLGLADVLFKEQRHDQAVLHYERAYEIQPDLAAAHAGRGAVMQEIGRIDEARHCFRRAIAIDPRRPGYYLSLTRSTALSLDDPGFAQMLALAEDLASLSDEDKVSLHFALGKALGDIGQHQHAFEHLLAGNALKRSSVSFNEAAQLASLDRTRRGFSMELMQRWQGTGEPSPAPIFVVGMPRSGSTLIEQVLASHPQVYGAGELAAFWEAIRAIGFHTRARRFPASIPEWTDERLCALGKDYLRRVDTLASAAVRHPHAFERITDKMPSNFRYVGLIHLALPNARIIHARRDPVDTCLSCFSLLFSKLNFTYNLGELGRYYGAYARLMRHWHSVLPAGVILDVQYESLVGDFESQARRIVAHCGLDWDDACLRFYETSRPVRTASVVQVRQPIYRHSIRRWRPDPEVLRPLLEGLGTEWSRSPDHPETAPPHHDDHVARVRVNP